MADALSSEPTLQPEVSTAPVQGMQTAGALPDGAVKNEIGPRPPAFPSFAELAKDTPYIPGESAVKPTPAPTVTGFSNLVQNANQSPQVGNAANVILSEGAVSVPGVANHVPATSAEISQAANAVQTPPATPVQTAAPTNIASSLDVASPAGSLQQASTEVQAAAVSPQAQKPSLLKNDRFQGLPASVLSQPQAGPARIVGPTMVKTLTAIPSEAASEAAAKEKQFDAAVYNDLIKIELEKLGLKGHAVHGISAHGQPDQFTRYEVSLTWNNPAVDPEQVHQAMNRAINGSAINFPEEVGVERWRTELRPAVSPQHAPAPLAAQPPLGPWTEQRAAELQAAVLPGAEVLSR